MHFTDLRRTQNVGGISLQAGAVLQTNVVAHTGADGFSRLARQAEFAGAIQPGCDYVLVDDFVGMGGTLANLKGSRRYP